MDRYGPGLSDRMVKCCHVTCRAALDQAVKQGLIVKKPADACKTPTTHPREMQVLTPEEIRRLLIQARENDCYELLLLELATGLRRGEILALQWEDLDFQTGALRLERQVQRVRRELVISADVYKRQEQGYPKTKNVLAKTKSDCLAKLKVLKDSLEEVKPERLSTDMCFGAWLDHWYQNQCKPTIAPKTLSLIHI